MINKDGSIRSHSFGIDPKTGAIKTRSRQTVALRNRTAKVTTSTAPWDKSEEAEFTAAWDKYKHQFNPFIACPECEGSDYVVLVEHEKYELMSSGIYEPVGVWKDCDNCNGLGEIQADENMEN